jgi:hypothetical protein
MSDVSIGDLNRSVRRAAEGSIVTRRISGETILVPVAGHVGDLDSVYTLNEVGSFIWDLIDGRRSARAIAEAVAAEYDVASDQAARDVADLLGELEAKGLVTGQVSTS